MQKYFLRGLTVAAVSLIALSAQAGESGPKVKVAGNLAVNAFAAQQKVRTDRSTTLGTTGEVRAEANAKAKNGVEYGMVATIDLDNATSNRIKNAYLLANHEKYGDWLLGDAESAGRLMGYSGEDIMAGLQGPTSSAFDKVVNVTAGVSMKNNMATKASSATKVTYMSPIKDGFRVGFSFTPSEAFTGMAVRTNKTSNDGNISKYVSGNTKQSIYAVNALEGALSYTHQLNTGGKVADVNWYLGGKMARSKATSAVYVGSGINPVRAMQAGVVVDYGDYQVGGGYYNNGRSYMRKSPTTKNWTNLEGFNVALGKKLDNIPGAYVSLGHTGSRRRVTQGYARGNVTSLGADYDIAKGLVVYTSVDMFDFKSPKAHQALIGNGTQYDYLDNSSSNNANNRGALFVVGTKIRF
jgi:hypothetical protein